MNYSQNNEQELIFKYFKGFKGTLLDLGANDGITLSNSFAAINKGWKGVLVEASPKTFLELEKTHKNNKDIQLLNVAVGMFNEKIIFYESGTLLKKGDSSLVSTIVEEELKRWSGIQFNKIEVDCYNFKTLYEKFNYKTFDLISIDVEGMDYKVLTQMNLTELGCKMLIVEFNGKNEADYITYTKKHNMKLYAKNLENLIFVV